MAFCARRLRSTSKCFLQHHLTHNGSVLQGKELQRSYATLKKLTRSVQHMDLEQDDQEFRILVIPGHTEVPDTGNTRRRSTRKETPPPRFKSMSTEQDWISVWPSAQSFKWSVVPFPVRQGFIDTPTENQGIPPGKYANAELMKIPNFLHVTPVHIKKHCQALKQFCTEWPTELSSDKECEKYFPIEIISQGYVFDGPSIRDARSRVVTLKVKLSSLDLDYHARDKLIRLAQHRYDPKTDILTVMTDRCPLKSQNSDYAQYLLTALYYESWKTEPWETEKTIADMECYDWEVMGAKKVIIGLVKNQLNRVNDNEDDTTLPHLTQLASNEIDIENLQVVQNYKKAVTNLHNEGEDLHSLEKLKNASKQLLLKNL